MKKVGTPEKTPAVATANVATVAWDEAIAKYVGSFNGQVLSRGNTAQYCIDHITTHSKKARSLGVKTAVHVKNASGSFGPVPVVDGTAIMDEINEMFTITERFTFMRNLIDMVIKKHARSVLISGPGGLGKSYEVKNALKEANLEDARWLAEKKKETEIANGKDVDNVIEDDDSIQDIEAKILGDMEDTMGGDYTIIKGYASPRGLYTTLYRHRDKIIIFDDCDSIQKDPNALNVLKAALDSDDERYVSWNSEPIGGSDIPTTFLFTGSIVFVSNLNLKKIDDALKTRCLIVDLQMTADQRLERMESVLENVSPDYEMNIKRDALNFLQENKDLCHDVNFRTLLAVIKVRAAASKKTDWKRLAKYLIMTAR